jgi:Zn-dependent peptidase ImmA (M78 family)
MVTAPSKANPKMLRWAREKAGLRAEDVASAEKIYLEQLLQWERGDTTPTMAQLRKLGKRYKRPLMVFYLSDPPQGFTVVKDYRHLPTSEATESPELRYVIRRAQERQSWASEYLAESGAPPNQFVGSLERDADVYQAATKFRQRLGVGLAAQEMCDSALGGFRLWRDAAEALGFFVFQAIHVTVNEMRGCALPDKFAPVALVNSKDADVAKTFTLIHELAHLLLGETAITGSNTDFELASHSPVERFCNRFAAEVLVPHDDLVRFVPKNWIEHETEILRAAARKYWVSRSVIAYRLVEAKLANKEWLNSRWSALQSAAKDTGGPQPQHLLALSRNGVAFPKLTISAYHGGEIHGGAVSNLLGMKLKHLPQLESVLYPGQVRTGLGA